MNTHFDGATFDATLDLSRLNAQMRRVYGVMQDGEWLSLREISQKTGDPEASISARLRDLRKERFGGFNVERRRLSHGLNQYRLSPPMQGGYAQ